jgi:amidophosphoribosyltransferase
MHAFSSESVGLDINGIKWDHEFRPGEFMCVEEGEALKRQLTNSSKRAFCAFEFAYFMRPDSRVNGRFVYQARADCGRALARVYEDKAKRCDIVVSLPETADDAAYGFHEEAGIPWERATRRHRYVTQRAFITDAEDRGSVIFRKVNILEPLIKGKNLAVVDDSIVRGDTTKGTVKRFRAAGAKEVHLFITYPRIIGPCFYGIDMATYTQLIGARMTPEQIAKEVGADSVNYLSIEDYVKCTGLPADQLCLGCITNNYPTPMADEFAKQMWERVKRGEAETGRIYESTR